jgi:hypothetical protein
MTADMKPDVITSVLARTCAQQRQCYEPQEVAVIILTDKYALATPECEKVRFKELLDISISLRFELFTAVTMKIDACGSCKYRRFGGT